MAVNLMSTFLGRTAHNHSSKKAALIITEVITNLRAGCMINNAFNSAN